MIVRVSLKDPDTLSDSIQDAVKKALADTPGLSADERELLAESRREKVYEAITDKWMAWGEYLMVQFDTDTDTATVLTRGESGQ